MKQEQAELLQLKDTVESLNSRMNDAQERIPEVEDIFCHKGETIKKLGLDLNQAKKEKKSIWELRDTIEDQIMKNYWSSRRDRKRSWV